MYIYPAKHFVTPEERIRTAVEGIRGELDERLAELKRQGKLLEAQRLAARTRYDLDMLLETGHCPGVENYARWFSGRKPGEPPYTLIDFFPEDFLMVVDESHVTLPQVRGMFAGDHSRKTTLVEHGFRLPSALDNRPYRFDEWEKRVKQVLFMSATPAAYELERTGGEVVEQVIRPTGLVDPVLHVKPARGQVPDLVDEIKKRAERKERTLVTTLTKRLAEDLSNYFREAGLRCKWLHSELDAIERVQMLARAARGGVRRAGGRQPAARRAGPAGGVAGGDPGRGQGRLPAERDVADPDDRPGGPQRQRRGDPLRRPRDRFDAAGHRRDGTAGASCS